MIDNHVSENRQIEGKNLVLLNKSETYYDSKATIAIHDDIKNVIEALEKKDN